MERDLLRRASQPLSPHEIKEWSRRASLEAYVPAADKGIVSRLYADISRLYKEVLRTVVESRARDTQLTKSLCRRLESGYTGFLAWGSDYSVEDGELDVVLGASSRLQHATIKIMMSICATLTEELVPLMKLDPEGAGQTIKSLADLVTNTMNDAFQIVQESTKELEDTLSDSSDGNSSWSSNPSLEDVVGTLKNDVECLMDMGPQLQDPPRVAAPNDAAPAPDVDPTEWNMVKHLSERIRARFPECRPSLVEACSRSVLSTLLRLHEARENATMTAADKRAPSQDNNADFDSAFFSGSSLTASAAQQTTGTTAGAAATARYASTIAPTVFSFKAGDGTKRARFPSQPKDVAIGHTFPCEACGQLVTKSSHDRAWKRHLLSDLRPWICCQVACRCDRKPFGAKEMWLRHLRAQHHLHPEWDDKTCPFCSVTIPEGGERTIAHVELHLQEISLMALSSQAEEDSEDIESNESTGGSDPTSTGELAAPIVGVPIGGKVLEIVCQHRVYKSAKPHADGLWHCPWEGEDCCTHEATMLKSEFNGYIAYHLDSFTCKIAGCATGGTPFSSFECLRLHEQSDHGMHKGSDRKYLCTSKGCGRSISGNGFANRWVLEDHIRVVHGNIEGLPPLPPDVEEDS